MRECIKRLADLDGFIWWIDQDKRLHYGPEGMETAPFELSSEPDLETTFPCFDFDYSVDAEQYENRITVRGGYFTGSDTETELPGNGQTTELALPWKAHAPVGQTGIQVWRNTGSDATPVWTAQTRG
jgi:hypothetical protein